MLKGKLQGTFLEHFVKTSDVLQELRKDGALFEGVPFGYCFFSTLHAHSSIAAHTAPTNLRLRVHLPLFVPTEPTATAVVESSSTGGSAPLCGMRVGSVVQRWTEGEPLVLDDSFDHEVWNHSDESRVVLLVDIWHPDITQHERSDIVQMFQHAYHQGWWTT
jgi:aspartate beta-hydroxylase